MYRVGCSHSEGSPVSGSVPQEILRKVGKDARVAQPVVVMVTISGKALNCSVMPLLWLLGVGEWLA